MAPCSFIVIGNTAYATNNCTGSVNQANFVPFSQGVNGNDVIALMLANGTLIDAVGRIGYDPGNGNSQKVNNVSNALFEKRIRRNQNNQARYTLTTGTYNPAIVGGPNIWPNNTTTNVQGWTVVGAGSVSAGGCLAAGQPLTWNTPVLNLNLSANTVSLPCPVTAPNTITLPTATASASVGPSGGIAVITWSGGSGTFIPATSPAQPTLYIPGPTDPQQFTLTVTATFMCKKVTAQVTINNGGAVLPMVDAGADKTFNCPQDSIQLTAVTFENSTFEWSTSGKGSFRNKNAKSTWYKVSPQDFTRLTFIAKVGNGCGANRQDAITVINGDSTDTGYTIEFTPQNPQVNQPVTFSIHKNAVAGSYAGTWTFGDGTAPVTATGTVQHTFTKAGNFIVETDFKNALGCPKGKLVREIVIIDPAQPEIPNIFTPNNDGLNDTFKPRLPETTMYEAKIYNRWGTLVFESTDPEKSWTGENASDGVYFLHLKAGFATRDAMDVKIPVTLMR